uniref:asparagine synthase (glutamine-hydrolyzing) n=1 Tax=Candidatus Kentrum eta TaxID=2126337 RepID=A0A450UW71_9GAMM|nr:MAG: asparagine synthase (glutamine-hydrolysing) [Candidatus Kentron sp. H]
MCGIAGIIDYENPLDRGVLERMQAALRYRGPDGQGLRMLPHAGLAHTRLSLLDPARGSQPMRSPDARYWIVYNGEVYNFRELRRDLRDSWDFETDCDTEVVLAAWAQWGKRCLTRLNGMFAFFVWDTREEKGWLARDLLGIKPVAWTNKGNFRFASEARVLAITRGAATPSITQGSAVRGDRLSILEYFVAPYCSGVTHSMFAGIHYLEPEQYLQVSREGVTSAFWGDHNPHPVANAPPPDLRPFLEKAVRMSMVSHVPVGYLLSGGIDSALVTRLGHGHTGRGNAYTIDIHGRDRFAENKDLLWLVADDVPYAARAARTFGVPHYPVPMDRLRDSRHIEEAALANELIPVLEEETTLHRLYERAAQVHPSIAFRDEGTAFKGNRVKRWLRHCAKGLLPEEIRLRRKSGTPFPRYVSGIYKRELKAILRRGGEEFYEEFLDVPRLTALCDETPDENRTAFLFRCIAFYYWVKHHRITGFA